MYRSIQLNDIRKFHFLLQSKTLSSLSFLSVLGSLLSNSFCYTSIPLRQGILKHVFDKQQFFLLHKIWINFKIFLLLIYGQGSYYKLINHVIYLFTSCWKANFYLFILVGMVGKQFWKQDLDSTHQFDKSNELSLI